MRSSRVLVLMFTSMPYKGPGKREHVKMMQLQPINTGDLIGIAQCALIWYGLYTMRAGTRQRDRALDEIIAQGREGREALRKSTEALAVLLQR